MQQNPETILSFILAFSVVSFGFIFYHVITSSPTYMLWGSLSNRNFIPIIIQRLTGVFFFGFIPLIIFAFSLESNFSNYGTGLPNLKTFLWLLVLAMAIIPMNYFNSKSPENLDQYPQIRHTEWPYSLVALSAVSWIAYLLAYEFMFRGLFLFASIPLLGVWPSIILNTAVYSLVHIPKGNKETLGAIPFGILICYLTIETGSFWIAFFAHVVLALSNEWFSLAAQPEMSVKKQRK
jgi:membrane protease YdiL (CAAX protease family)